MSNVNQNGKSTGTREPLWVSRANNLDHKPDFVDGIPDRLKELGSVFFPIPSRQKGWKYPHSVDDYRYSWDSKTLNAYLEAGWNYGIACADDLVVVDVDSKLWLDEILDMLPPSMYQKTGSGSGFHIFYRVEDFDRGASLKTTEENHGVSNFEVGDIKGHRHSYVVGPGSTHPSGNTYGPLVGDEIVELEKSKMERLIDVFSGDGNEAKPNVGIDRSKVETSGIHDFYQLSAGDVAPHLSPEQRTSNPFHGSSTGTNFMVNEDGETFTCWRCNFGSGEGCGLSGVHYLAGLAIKDELANYHCEHIRANWHTDHTLHWKAWLEAVKAKLVDPTDPPYTVLLGFAEEYGDIDGDNNLSPRRLHLLDQQVTYVSVELARANR